MPATPPKKTLFLLSVFLVAAFGSTSPFPLLAQDAPPVLTPTPVIPAPTPGEPKHLPRLRALLSSIDAQYSVFLGLLPQARADLHKLTIATKDLSLVSLNVFQRALAVCLLTPIDLAEAGDLVGATVATVKIKSCLDTFPVQILDQIAALPNDERITVLGILLTANELRINLFLVAPQVQALTEASAKALLEYAELSATITAEYEFTKLDLFASDEAKAAAKAAFDTHKAALAVVEAKLQSISADLLKLPAEALEISKAALALSVNP